VQMCVNSFAMVNQLLMSELRRSNVVTSCY
jgi:hypothetical protein